MILHALNKYILIYKIMIHIFHNSKNNKEDYQKESKTILEQIKVPNRIPSESKIISIDDICLPGTKLWWNSSKIAKDIPIRSEP